ncbi:MAG: DEAD/DEAH box helicase domain protein [Candidatus Magnetoglobus multicellularis str. Araruama]|uniref:RNA helicase n=1 Tax=Candidatus Magnetoglobus multicellularis str. Araruama TaxID=890399 RepID=A0A1V1PFM8_9BACT|nr:MAG: DEAD/DEAH box helicase domain protein [Candidatus Magnetoglobus multicellularis str. Araruama]
MNNQKTFDDFGFSPEVIEAINQKGFEEPTSIQIMTIPVMLQNNTNLIAQAQTGTGKTAAFGLPLIEMIAPQKATIQALILVPTRELAIQVSEEINSLKGSKDLKIIPIYGGQSIAQQFRRLKKKVHIIVGTPGRIIDHLNRKTLFLENINHLIIDEADEMLNMGFIEDVEEIMKHTNPHKKTFLFSATIPEKIKNLANKYMEDYSFLKVKKKQLTPHLTEQIYFEIKASEKIEALCRIIDVTDDFYGLIFCRTKMDVDDLVSRLIDRGYDAEPIHGDISQAQRERTLDKFKKQRTNILVATDVAARGIDVYNLSHVINYALPQDPESYVHRIGRTGRAGNEGTAITFITPSEYKRLRFIQRIAKADIKRSSVPKVKDIINAKKKKIDDDLISLLEEDIDKKYYNWAKKLLEDKNPTDILAAMLNYCFEEEINPDTYGKITDIAPPIKELNQQGKARLFVALGKKDKMTPKKLVSLIMSRVSVKSRQIKDVQVMEKFSFVTVPFDKAEKIVLSFKQKGEKPLITHAKK